VPTKNPRINVTLSPAVAAMLRRMSQLNKKSQSAIIGELLEASQPVFERMVRVLEAAEQAQASVKAQIRGNLEAAEEALDKQLGLMLGDIETRTGDLVDDLEQVRRRTAAASRVAAGAAGGPPPSNRGGATPNRRGKDRAKRSGRALRRGHR
jgi:hypothetical protein